jgi:hypothetical protein
MWVDVPLKATPACVLCGHTAAVNVAETGWLCVTCETAWQARISIEEARLEAEECARWWTARLSTESCTCDAGPETLHVPDGLVHLDVYHEPGCPKAPPQVEWTPVNEDVRERLFGYRGRDFHALRLVVLLRHVLHEREVMET